VILSICRFCLALIWIYQGVVPKWMGPHLDELQMNLALGLSPLQATRLSWLAGAVEITLGLYILLFHQQRWPYITSLFGILALQVYVLLMAPQFLVSAFNATTVNLAIAGLSLIAVIEIGRTASKR